MTKLYHKIARPDFLQYMETFHGSDGMDRTNVHIMDFVDLRSAKPVFQTNKLIWLGLVIIEILLFIRLILGYLDANLTSSLAYVIYTITDYIVYPFTTTFTSASGDGNYSWVIIVAIIGYFLLTITLVGFLKVGRTPRSRIEYARALSRRKYSR
jgi:uncharacterized protein YggT (Ycf19 family)